MERKINFILKLGVFYASLLTTGIAVFFSAILTYVILKITGNQVLVIDMIISVIAPSMIATPLVIVYVNLLNNIADLEVKMRDIASHDHLTSMFTRRSTIEAGNYISSMSKRYHTTYSVVFLDIDFFKKVNDAFGHAIGDKVLQNTSKIIQENKRGSDICGRYGGEEILMILPKTDIDGAFVLAEKIRSKIEQSYIYCKDQKISITVSIGVCDSKTAFSKDVTEIINKADLALYHSKETGRNKITMFNSNMDKN